MKLHLAGRVKSLHPPPPPPPPGANVFLSHDSIKLGDFGLSVQLKNLNKTMPNEIRQQVGTVRESSPAPFL